MACELPGVPRFYSEHAGQYALAGQQRRIGSGDLPVIVGIYRDLKESELAEINTAETGLGAEHRAYQTAVDGELLNLTRPFYASTGGSVIHFELHDFGSIYNRDTACIGETALEWEELGFRLGCCNKYRKQGGPHAADKATEGKCGFS